MVDGLDIENKRRLYKKEAFGQKPTRVWDWQCGLLSAFSKTVGNETHIRKRDADEMNTHRNTHTQTYTQTLTYTETHKLTHNHTHTHKQMPNGLFRTSTITDWRPREMKSFICRLDSAMGQVQPSLALLSKLRHEMNIHDLLRGGYTSQARAGVCERATVTAEEFAFEPTTDENFNI